MSMYAKAVPKKDNTIKDLRVSNCTDCTRGIFPHHKYKWTSRGLVHTECDNEIKNAA